MANKRPAAHTKAQKLGRLRDGNVCQICGSSNHVEGHHILDFRFNGAANIENIISLCNKHHNDVHRGLIDILKF